MNLKSAHIVFVHTTYVCADELQKFCFKYEIFSFVYSMTVLTNSKNPFSNPLKTA
jgi:hypothetical protein